MKNILKICVITFAMIFSFAIYGFAQEQNKNEEKGQGKGKNKIENTGQQNHGKHGKGRMHRNCCDSTNTKCNNFVDKDGDGINDNRCTGMGLGRKKRHGQKIMPIDTTEKPKK